MCLVGCESAASPSSEGQLAAPGREGVLGGMESEVTSYRSTPKRDLLGRSREISVRVKWLRHLSGRPSMVLGFLR